VNFIDNISPGPRGWDGLNQYVNIAKRISEAGGLITMGGNYYWELIMSLGFTMFNWTTITLNLASFFPAALCLIGLYFILRKFISKRSALISTAAVYMTPMFSFHGVEENKIDLGNFAIGIIAFLSIYLGITAESKREKFAYIAIAGLLAGFCLGIKLTSLILILAGVATVLYDTYKWKGALAGLLFSVSIIFLTSSISMGTELVIPQSLNLIIGGVLLTASIGLTAMFVLKTENRKGLKTALIFVAFAGLAFSPWAIKNFSGTLSLDTNSLLFGKNPQPYIDEAMLAENYGYDGGLCQGTGTYEELDRYLGYSPFVIKYLTLPWHLTMNDEGTQGLYIDIGWVFLAFIPAFLLFIPFKKIDEKWKLIMWFGICYWVLWLITCNGIIWYGLPGFTVLALWTGGLMDRYTEANGRMGKIILNILVVALLITSLVFRLGMAGKGTLLLYTSGVMTAEEAQLAIFPSSGLVTEIFENDQDGKYDLIWKIGTPLNYFIPDNFWRTYNDQYIDRLNCLYMERDPELLTERLKALGFGYIIFDYYTYTLSPDPNSTLMEKYNATFDYIMNYTELVVPDYYRGHFVVKIPGT
ncbi:MAG: hypothetical protein ACD_65C00330G0001, partial [uncultured bacterium]